MKSLGKIKENSIVAFKPKGNGEYFTGYCKDIFKPNSKYNKHDYYTFRIEVILPIHPQWIEDGDKTVYFHDEVEDLLMIK